MSKKPKYETLSEIILKAVQTLRPSERLPVSIAAARYRYIRNVGSYTGQWRNSTVPYMIEPMNMLASEYHDQTIMVAPAQSGKTDSLILNWVLYSVVVDPMDLIIYNPSTTTSRDFATRRLGRMNQHTPAMRKLISTAKDADNKTDKNYTNGVIVTLSHPSKNEMSGKPVPRVALTDFDRMPMDVDGEGNPFDLAAKRTTTFGSYKMAMAESSPSFPITNPNWIPSTPHEAPPTEGIFALYNRGDRRRWYWPCPHCERYFEGTFTMLKWNDKLETPSDIAESVYMECPHCSGRIEQHHKHNMNLYGQWLADGQYFDADGEIIGRPRKTLTSSFWLKGVAAAFVTWSKLVVEYINAEEEYEKTQSEQSLMKFYNTDLAEPYVPKKLLAVRTSDMLMNRAEYIGDRVVPEQVRFLVATIDVQKASFVVSVNGIAAGAPFDVYVIDRFEIRKSNRVDDEGDALWVKPSAYLEDWDLIVTEVMDRTYPLDDDSGRVMRIYYTTCDSGGYARDKGQSVTGMAYQFYRKLKANGRADRFHLVRGASSRSAPMIQIKYPDADRKDAYNVARGDIPVMMFNGNNLKDILNNRLDVDEVGKGMIHFPDWLSEEYFKELCSEVRTPTGWEKQPHTNNEAWDLLYYLLGVCMSKKIHADRIDWEKPKPIAKPWDDNYLVFKPDAAKDDVLVVGKPRKSLKDLGNLIG